MRTEEYFATKKRELKYKPAQPTDPIQQEPENFHFDFVKSLQSENFALFILFVHQQALITPRSKKANEKVKMEDLIKVALQWPVMAWGSHCFILVIIIAITTIINFDIAIINHHLNLSNHHQINFTKTGVETGSDGQ